MRTTIILLATLLAVVSGTYAQDGYPPLPSARELASGDAGGFISAIYASARNAQTEAFDQAEADIETIKAEWNEENIGKPEIIKLLARYGEPDANDDTPLTRAETKRRVDDFVAPNLLQGLDITALSKMSDREAEAYAMQIASQQTGLSEADIKRLDKMNDREAKAFMENRMNSGGGGSAGGGGTPAEQEYEREWETFDRWRETERSRVAEEMKERYRRKYHALLQECEENMEKCSEEPDGEQCFDETYRRWRTVKEDYRVECYSLWRVQITAEQERYRQLAGKDRFAGLGERISEDRMKIALDVLTLPELEIGNQW